MFKRLLFAAFLLALLPGCIPSLRSFAGERWQYADLRLIDPVDASDPQLDLIAAYARCSDDALDIRVDMLESMDPWVYDLYLAIDDRPGGRRDLPLGGTSELAWDVWIELKGDQPNTAQRADGSAAVVRAWRNTRLDYARVQIPVESKCRNNIRIQAFLTPAGENQIADQTDSFTLDGRPPERADVLLAFSDVLPGATPAQSLRRWNGAHTGPFGQRHGLSVLLEAVDWTKVPITLLDLNQPTSLSALDAVGGLAFVRDLSRQGLISLPIVKFSSPGEGSLDRIDRTFARDAGLVTSTLTYDPSGRSLDGKQVSFFSEESDQVVSGGQNASESSTNETPLRQADEGGLTLPVKLALLEAALGPNPSQPVILGGSLPQSEWADAEIALPALEYIASHPWIRPLYGHDLAARSSIPAQIRSAQAFKSSWLCEMEDLRGFDAFGNPLPYSVAQQIDLLSAQLAALPDSPFTGQAFTAWNMMNRPAADCELAALRANYLGEIGYLIAAAHWSQHPEPQANCAIDLDLDGQVECLLSNQYVFAVLEPDGARLAFAALRTESDAFQISGGHSQFGFGLADPLAWRLELGPRADPYLLAGAFDDAGSPARQYEWQAVDGTISFVHPDTGQKKTYELHDDRLRVTITRFSGRQVQVPLVVAPQVRFRPDWTERYIAQQSPAENSLRWGVVDDKIVEIMIEGAAYRLDTFLDSSALIRQFEDPNYEYPEGHYLPFPTALLTLQVEAPEVSVTLGPANFP